MYPHALLRLLNEPENNRVTVVTLLKSVKDNHVSKKCQIKKLTMPGYVLQQRLFHGNT